MPLRILVADDHVAVAESFQVLLEKQDWHVRVAHSPDDIDTVLQSWTPDIALLDIEFRGADRTGFDVARSMAKSCPETKIVFLSMHTDAVFPEEARKAEAKGFLGKSMPSSQIVEAIRQVGAGGTWFPPRRERRPIRLSRQQMEVVRHLARGLHYKAAAGLMGRSISVVKLHIRRALQRTGAKTPAELVRIAQQRGWLLLPLPPSRGGGKALTVSERLWCPLFARN